MGLEPLEKAPIALRPVDAGDLAWLLLLRKEVRGFLGDNDIPGLEAQRAWLERIKHDRSVRYFIVECRAASTRLRALPGTPLGLVRITHIDPINRSACVGGDIHPDYQGQGCGAAMMDEIKRYCFDVLNLRRLWLLVLADNERAKNLYTKAGFQAEGVQREAIWRGGKYVDYLMMSLIREGAR